MDAKLLRIAKKFEGCIVEKSKIATIADKFMRKLGQEASLAPPFKFPQTEEEAKTDPWMLDDAPEEAAKPWNPPKPGPVVIPEVTIEGVPNSEMGAAAPKPSGHPKPPPASLAPPFQFPKTEEEEKLEQWLVKEQSMQKRVNYFLKLAK